MESEAQGHDLLEQLSAPLKDLDLTSPAADSKVVADCENLLTRAHGLLDPSTPSGLMLLDCIGLELPCKIIKYTTISQTCRQISELILKDSLDVCNARDMFTSYMEALNMYSEPGSVTLCPLLLDGIVIIFTRIRTRKFEFFKESVSGLLNIARLAVETGVETSQIFHKLAALVMTLWVISTNEQVERQRERLQQMLGSFTLLLLAKLCDSDELDNSRIMHSVVVQLTNLLPGCGFAYSDLLIGSFLEDTVRCVHEECCIVDFELSGLRRGAALAVYWRFCFDNEADNDHKELESLCLRIKSSKHVFVDALCNVRVLLIPQQTSGRGVEYGIALLSIILDLWTIPADNSDDIQSVEVNTFILKLGSLLQVIEDLIIYCPKPKIRQQAYSIFVKIITAVPPAVERYSMLKVLVIDSEHPSMVSLLLGIVKEEAGKAISLRNAIVLEAGGREQDLGLASPFANEKVLELIEPVFRPASGGPPDLPNQIDAVLAALNFYRFLLIKETTGKTNYTGVSSKSKLQEALSNWFMPLRGVIENLHRSANDDGSESSLCMLLDLDILKGVLYRCIELVEEALRHSS